MKEIFVAIFLGIVQGLTEFLPISSTGHLVLLHNFFSDFSFLNSLSFDVSLHFGTLLSLIVFFWKDLCGYSRQFLIFFRAVINRRQVTNEDKTLGYIFFAIIPAGVAGFFLENIIEKYLRSTTVVVGMLIFVGLLFIIIEKWYAGKSKLELSSLTWRKVLFIGCCQALALIPGVSRSGITLVGGMMMSLKREAAARFSFLIAIPIIAAAGVKELINFWQMPGADLNFPPLIFGILSAALTGFLAIKILLSFVRQHSLVIFALYRIILAMIIIAVSLL